MTVSVFLVTQSFKYYRWNDKLAVRREGEKATDLTQTRWPSSVNDGAAVTTSQSPTVSLPEPDATSLPSSEKAAELTQAR
jgi:hypothetical protein